MNKIQEVVDKARDKCKYCTTYKDCQKKYGWKNKVCENYNQKKDGIISKCIVKAKYAHKLYIKWTDYMANQRLIITAHDPHSIPHFIDREYKEIISLYKEQVEEYKAKDNYIALEYPTRQDMRNEIAKGHKQVEELKGVIKKQNELINGAECGYGSLIEQGYWSGCEHAEQHYKPIVEELKNENKELKEAYENSCDRYQKHCLDYISKDRVKQIIEEMKFELSTINYNKAKEFLINKIEGE
jgi:hypothetical protein